MNGENVGGIYYDVTLDTQKLVTERRRVELEVERAASSFNLITRAVKLYAAAQTLLKASEMADDFRLLQARVNVASQSIEAGADAFEKLRQVSVSTRSALADNVQVFTRLNPSIRQMGGNASDTLRIVELLSKAITVSGATAAEKSSAMIQFGQALGSGKLAGDELRSLLENAPYLMKQLAAGLGVPIGALKSLGEQGKLTADVVVNALGKAADSINRDFAQFPKTLSSAFVVAGDALKRLNEKIDAFTSKSTVLTGIVEGVGKAVGTLADMFDNAAKSADELGRNEEIKDWSRTTATVLSYVADAADVTLQTLTVLGRNVGFVFSSIGREIDGIGAQVAAVVRGDFSGARAIGAAMRAEAEKNRKDLDASDARTLADRRTWGQQMRDEMAAATMPAADAAAAAMRRGNARDAGASTVKGQVDPEEQRKLAAKRAAAQAYYDGLLADAQQGLAKIALEEQKALQDNIKRSQEDPKNADIYARAKTAIVAKYARERALLEEQYAKETAAANIAVTTDESQRIEAIRSEAFRAADAEVRLGVKTFEQGEQAKRVAAFQTAQAILDLTERNARARYEQQMAETRDTETRIRLTKEETVRALELAAARGKITAEELAAGRARAQRQAEEDTRALNRGRGDAVIDTLQLRAGAGGVDDQVALIQAEAARRLQATIEAQQADLANAQVYADLRVAIEEDMQRRLTSTRALANQNALLSTANAFEALANATRSGTDKQDAVYKAAFLAQKAFSLAASIVAIQTGVAQASALPFPANLGAMASVIAATASIITTIKGTQYGGGRRYGGAVSEGTMYRVNESGRPEMFTAAGGAQYMLPTRDGRVTSADQVGAQASGGASAQRPLQVTQQFLVQGATDMRSQQQIAAAAQRGLLAASQRNN